MSLSNYDKVVLWGGGVLAYLYYTYNRWRKVDVSLQGYEISSTDLIGNKINLAVKLKVYNPLIVSIPLYRIYGSIGMDGTQVAIIDNVYNGKIKANTTSYITIPVAATITEVLKAKNASIMNLDIKVVIGTKSRNIEAPIKTDIEVSI